MILPAIEPWVPGRAPDVPGGLRAVIGDDNGDYLAVGFVYPDGDVSLVVDGQCYQLVFQVTWDW